MYLWGHVVKARRVAWGMHAIFAAYNGWMGRRVAWGMHAIFAVYNGRMGRRVAWGMHAIFAAYNGRIGHTGPPVSHVRWYWPVWRYVSH